MSNPFTESLGAMLTEEEFLNIVEAPPKAESELPEALSIEDKLALSSYITDVYCPPSNAYKLYQEFYTGIYNSLDVKYGTKATRQIRVLHEIATGEDNKSLIPFVKGGKILFVIGKPRSGKSELVGRSLSCMEQVIFHNTYNQEIFAEVQVNFVIVEYQYNDSLLQLYETLIAQICQITGKKMMVGFGIKQHGSSMLEALENTIFRMCISYHVGTIILEDFEDTQYKTTKTLGLKLALPPASLADTLCRPAEKKVANIYVVASNSYYCDGILGYIRIFILNRSIRVYRSNLVAVSTGNPANS